MSVALIFSIKEEAVAQAFEPDTQTVVLWNFDEGEGDTTVDQGSAGVDLKLSEDGREFASWTEGKFGKALSFPGTVRLRPVQQQGSVVELPDGVTVECWIRPDSALKGNSGGIVQIMQFGERGFRLILDNEGRARWMVQGGGKEYTVKTEGEIPDDTWTLITATCDGSTMKIYVNGDLNGETAVQGLVVDPGETNIIVGAFDAPQDTNFRGEIDAIRISNGVRNDTQQP